MNILVLTDDRASNTKQSLSLAKAISENTEKISKIDIVEVKFRILSKLPNVINIFPFTFKYKIDKRKKYDLIISCGRKLANLSLRLKQKWEKNETKNICILNPNYPLKYFDIIVLPFHDKIQESEENNIVNVFGAISHLDNDMLKDELKKWSWLEKTFHSPYISVMIGGSSKHFNFTEENGLKFINYLNNIALKMDASLLITTSRRTPEHIINNLKENLTCSNYIYTYSKEKKDNPYVAFLEIGDYFITTGDSISMISEICETGRPIYVYSEGINCQKYSLFLEHIKSKGAIRELDSSVEKLVKFRYKKLNIMNEIAEKIILKLKSIEFKNKLKK